MQQVERYVGENQMVFSVIDHQVWYGPITAYTGTSLLQKTHKFVLISEVSLFKGGNIYIYMNLLSVLINQVHNLGRDAF